MEERKSRDSHSFTWGMIVGGAVMLMLTTKKGRDILKELAESGYEGIEEFVDLEKVKELAGQFDDADESDSEVEQQPQKEVKPKRRRIFRGVKK